MSYPAVNCQRSNRQQPAPAVNRWMGDDGPAAVRCTSRCRQASRRHRHGICHPGRSSGGCIRFGPGIMVGIVGRYLDWQTVLLLTLSRFSRSFDGLRAKSFCNVNCGHAREAILTTNSKRCHRHDIIRNCPLIIGKYQ